MVLPAPQGSTINLSHLGHRRCLEHIAGFLLICTRIAERLKPPLGDGS